MEDDHMKKSSSLTPNYVTLVQLQQRWLQRKQREKEKEEEQIKRREKEHEDRENQKKKLQNKNGDRSKKTNDSFRRGSFNNNRPEKSFEKTQVVTIVEPKKIDDFKKKKKKNKGKPRAEEGLIDGSERLLPENEPAAAEEEESLVVSSDVQRNGKNLVVNGGRVWEKKVRVDGSEEIGGKLKEISVSGERYGRKTDLRNYNRDTTRSNDRRRVTSMVWVKKGESSEVNFAGVGSAGVAAKDGGQRKPVQMRQRIPVRESYRKRID